MARQLTTTDTQIQASLRAIDGYLGNMKNYAHTVQTIRDEVFANYSAASAARFLQRIDDWLGRYAAITRQYNLLHGDLQTAAALIARGEQDAQQQA